MEKRTRTRLVEIKEEYYISTDGEEFATAEQCAEYEKNAQTMGFNFDKPEKETKSKRVNLVLQPSLYEEAQNVAKANGISFNEMVTQILKQITKTEDEG